MMLMLMVLMMLMMMMIGELMVGSSRRQILRSKKIRAVDFTGEWMVQA
jgi:hypothetical protein